MRYRNILSLAFAALALSLLTAGTEPQWAVVKDGSLTSTLKVTGVCLFGAATVKHNLIVAAGASLNDHAMSPQTTVHVGGNVLVGKGGIFGFGTRTDGTWLVPICAPMTSTPLIIKV